MPLAADILDAIEVHPTPHLALCESGRVLFVNRAAKELLGTTEHLAIGHPWYALLRPSERDRARRTALPQNGEWEFADELGGSLRCRLTLLPVEVVEGAAGLVALTDARTDDEAAASLRRRETNLRDLASSVPGALIQYVLFPDGTDRVDFVSPGCAELWELDAEVVERDVALLWGMVHTEDVANLQASIVHSSKSLEPWFHEWRITTPSGKRKWLQGTGRPRLLPDGSVLWHTFILDVTERKLIEHRQEDLFRASRERFRSLAVRLQEVREDERKELARELHDQIGQYLTVMAMDLHQIERRFKDGEGAEASIEHLSAMLGETLDVVQRLTARLRPPMLDVRGLGPAIAAHVKNNLDVESNVVFHLDLEDGGVARRDLDPDRSLALFRVFQESTTNIQRHAQASEAWIRLCVRGGALVLVVEDEGVGITQEQLDGPESLGLIGMRERMHTIGGTFSATTRPGGGTVIRATAPLVGH